MIAFKGATRYEAQVGRVWVKLLRPGFWRSSWRRNRWRRLILVGREPDDV